MNTFLLATAICMAASAVAAATAAGAPDYPSRPLRVIVPFAPGGPADIVARLVGQRLGEQWGQQLIVENRTGAGGNVGVAAAAKAAPDGYTLLVTTSSIAVNATLSAAPGYDAQRDFAPVVNVAWTPNMIVTHREGATSLLRLIGQAKAKGLVYGSAGTGTTPHLTAEYLFKNLAGLDTTHVPYKGAAPAVIAALAAEVPVVSVAMPAAIAHIRSGKLRGLAVTSERRVSALPDVPTVQESGFPGFDDYTWVGVFAPVGTPASVIAKINADVNALLSHPGARERLAGFAFEPLGGSADSFAAFVKAEVVKWARVVRETGAKIE